MAILRTLPVPRRESAFRLSVIFRTLSESITDWFIMLRIFFDKKGCVSPGPAAGYRSAAATKPGTHPAPVYRLTLPASTPDNAGAISNNSSEIGRAHV